MPTQFDFNGVFDAQETIKIEGTVEFDDGALISVSAGGKIQITGTAHVVTDQELDVSFVPAPPTVAPAPVASVPPTSDPAPVVVPPTADTPPAAAG